MQQETTLDHDILAELRNALEAGLAPTNARVADLEVRLDEAREDLRLAQARAATPTAREDGLGGRVLNVDAARVFLASARHGGETRALDGAALANGGRLTPEQSDRFLDWVVAEQGTLSRAHLRRMSAPQALLEELTVARRKLRAGVENTAPASANGASTRKRSLATREVVWAEDVTLAFLEDNIERGNAEAHLARLLATQVGNDLNDLALNGDSEALGADADFLAIDDGWLKIAASDPAAHPVDASGLTTASAVLKRAFAALPRKYKGRNDLAFIAPVPVVEAYLGELAGRGTGLGDRALVAGLPEARYFGMLLVPETSLEASLLLTPLANLVLGVQRDIRVESMYQPRKRAVEYTVSARVDFEYANPDAVVLAATLPDLA